MALSASNRSKLILSVSGLLDDDWLTSNTAAVQIIKEGKEKAILNGIIDHKNKLVAVALGDLGLEHGKYSARLMIGWSDGSTVYSKFAHSFEIMNGFFKPSLAV